MVNGLLTSFVGGMLRRCSELRASMESRALPKVSRSLPGPHPDPPPDLAQRSLPFASPTEPFYRIYRCERDPLYFGMSGDSRFDSPARSFGVLYTACDLHGAFIETLGQVHPTLGQLALTMEGLAFRCLALVEPSDPLRLVDLTAEGLALIGADSRLFAGEHTVAQRWSEALWTHPEAPDGLLYRARRDPSRLSVALYDRISDRVRVRYLGTLVEQANLLQTLRILDHYGGSLLD